MTAVATSAAPAARRARRTMAVATAALAGRLLWELLSPLPLLGGDGTLRALVAIAAGVLAASAVALWRGDRATAAAAAAVLAGSVAFELVIVGRGRLFAEPELVLAALAGWWAGAALGGRDAVVRDALGREGALGALGAAWCLAAVSKLRDGGLGWFAPGSVWHLLLGAHDLALDADGAVAAGAGPVVLALLRWPWLAAALATATVLAELAAPLLALPGRPRRAAALALCAVHLGLDVLGGLGHWPLVAFLAVLAWPATPPPPPLSRRRLLQGAAVALVLAALAWALPIDRWLALPPGRRSAAWSIAAR